MTDRGRLLAGRLGLALAAGLALALARPPVGFSAIAFVALVPLAWLWHDASPRTAALTGFVAGVAYHGFLLSWAWYFGTVAIVPFAGVLGAYWALVGAVVATLGRHGLRSPWLAAAVWVLGEALVSRWPFGGFSWAEVGYALVDLAPARALAAWGGVPLVSFLVVAGSFAVADGLRTRLADRADRTRVGAVLGAVVALAGLATLTWPDTTESGPVRFALLQGNDVNRDLTAAERSARLLPTNHFDLAGDLEGPFDLVVFPESSLDEDPRTDPWLTDELRAVARRLDAHVLANAVVDDPDAPRERAINLNLLYDPDGSLQGTYAKRQLVPFGEWIPFRSVLEGRIGALDQIPRDFVPGDDPALFDVAGRRVATIICFESAFGPLVREVTDLGAELVVVSTNNRSFRRSANSAQHLELTRMRAAETGRPILHASISGITGVVDHRGAVLDRTELFVNSATVGTIEARTGRTPYVRYGEWVVLGALVGVAAATGAAAARRATGPVASAGEGRERGDAIPAPDPTSSTEGP